MALCPCSDYLLYGKSTHWIILRNVMKHCSDNGLLCDLICVFLVVTTGTSMKTDANRHLDGVRAVRRRHSLYHHGISHIISHSEWIQIHIEIPLYLHRYVLPIWVQYIHFSRHELLYLIPMDILQNGNL